MVHIIVIVLIANLLELLFLWFLESREKRRGEGARPSLRSLSLSHHKTRKKKLREIIKYTATQYAVRITRTVRGSTPKERPSTRMKKTNRILHTVAVVRRHYRNALIMDGSTRVRGWMTLTPTPVYSKGCSILRTVQ